MIKHWTNKIYLKFDINIEHINVLKVRYKHWTYKIYLKFDINIEHINVLKVWLNIEQIKYT